MQNRNVIGFQSPQKVTVIRRVNNSIKFFMKIFLLIDIVFFVIIGLSLSNASKQNCHYELGELIQIFAFLGILIIQWNIFQKVNSKRESISKNQHKNNLIITIILGIGGAILIGLHQTFDTGHCSTNISASLLVLYFVFLVQTVLLAIYFLIAAKIKRI